jgi:hypothetical protein
VSDPWADPTTSTQPGQPYAGPPPTAPQPWAAPPQYGYGWPSVPPAWGWPPPRPRKPGQVIAAAVLAFVQTAIALVGTLYTYMLSALVGLTADQGVVGGDPTVRTLASEGTVLAVVQLGSLVPLVVGGIMALNRRSHTAWLVLVLALAGQVLIALYWAVRLSGLIGEEFDAEGAPLVAFTLFFAVAPVVALGLLAVGAGRRWFAEQPTA